MQGKFPRRQPGGVSLSSPVDGPKIVLMPVERI
jgi:hypothetical protein